MGAPLLRAVAGALLALLVLASPRSAATQEAATPAPAPLPGRPLVAAVELLSDAPLDDLPAALELVTLEPGSPYDEREARRSLRNLRASGLAAEAEVWTRPAAPGDCPRCGAAPAGAVVVMVAVWTNVLVEAVDLTGTDLGLKAETLRQEVEATAGEPLIEDRVVRSVYRLQDRLRAEGYFDGSVRAKVAVDDSRKRARVAFAIAAGARATIGEVAFDGPAGPFSSAQLVAALRARPGERYRQSTVRDDGERLRRWLHEQGYRQAEVELLGERYDPARHAVDLSYRLDVHGRVTVEVVGAELRRLRRHDLLPFLGDEGYDEVVVLQAMQRITRYYQERGHYRVQVERREEKQGEDVHLTLIVRPGPVYTLRAVRFAGSEGVSEAKLRALMNTGERRLLVAGSGRLVDEVLTSDLENIRAYYALQGWGQAKVGPPQVVESGDSLELTVPLVEGPRSRVVDLQFAGVASIDAAKLRAELPLRAGGPFHPRLLEEALDLVRSRYEQEGYPYAQVSATTDWNPDHTLVDVTLQVLEGPQQVAANLVIRGNRQTRTEVVRLLAGLEQGEPLSRRRLLEAQRNLYRLGIFSRVDVTLAPSGESVRERDVVIDVREGRNQRVAYGVGYDSQEGPGGLFSYSHGNLLGRALHFQLDARASSRTRRFRLLLNQPYWGGTWPGSITYLLYQESERRPSFRVSQRGAQAELSRGRNRLRFSLFTDYRQVDLGPGDERFDLSELPPPVQRAFQDIKILSLVPRVVWDDRDDPIDPHRGTQVIAQLKYAIPIAHVAEQHFLELFGQLVHYWDLRGIGVVAASLRGGGIEPFGNRPVSIAESFFAGGRTTHRAYDRDALGIPDQTLILGNAIGGKGLLLVNLDYRFPIAGALGGTVFADAGNVWADWRDVHLRDIKPGAGLGLRYLTPIGPLRVEVGWKLRREPGEPKSAVLVSFGNAF
ncbi:MAG TPA: POTRA domain-containing protein [Thermoanaerobaculia bacterium]|nr:POTRA domain-containing protein [Thermoanaerobaculia bacterium]